VTLVTFPHSPAPIPPFVKPPPDGGPIVICTFQKRSITYFSLPPRPVLPLMPLPVIFCEPFLCCTPFLHEMKCLFPHPSTFLSFTPPSSSYFWHDRLSSQISSSSLTKFGLFFPELSCVRLLANAFWSLKKTQTRDSFFLIVSSSDPQWALPPSCHTTAFPGSLFLNGSSLQQASFSLQTPPASSPES